MFLSPTPILSRFILAILAFFNCAIVSAQDASFQFIEPPRVGAAGNYTGNKVYQIGSTMNITWAASYSLASITISQDDGLGDKSNYQIKKDLYCTVSTCSYQWVVAVLPNLSLDRNPVFWLSINQNGNGYFNSHYFNISRQAPTPSTLTTISTSSMTVTDTPKTVTVTATNLASIQSLTAKYNQAHTNEKGLGAGFGILLFILLVGGGLAAWYILKLRRLRDTAVHNPTPPPTVPTSSFIHGWDEETVASEVPRSHYTGMRETMSTR